jgi:hypothetical protein
MIKSKDLVINENGENIEHNFFYMEKEIKSGKDMGKLRTSHSVVNIVVPRHLWGPIQSIRTQYIKNARCGPHISFLDPFISKQYYPKAAELLRNALSSFTPFTIYLEELSYFVHARSYSVYLIPRTEPPGAIQALLDICLTVFPQCTDLLEKSPNEQFQPHITVAQFTAETDAMEFIKIQNKNWRRISFIVQELYFLSRAGDYPFSVENVVPLGSDYASIVPKPFFGLGSVSDTSRLKRTAFCANISDLRKLHGDYKTETILNPDGTTRFHIFEVSNLDSFTQLLSLHPGCFVPLELTVYPTVTDDCCSYNFVKNHLDDPEIWWNSLNNLDFSPLETEPSENIITIV